MTDLIESEDNRPRTNLYLDGGLKLGDLNAGKFDFGERIIIELSPIAWFKIDWQAEIKVDDEPEPFMISGIFTIHSDDEINLEKTIRDILIRSCHIEPNWSVQIVFHRLIIKDWEITNANVDDKSDISMQPPPIG